MLSKLITVGLALGTASATCGNLKEGYQAIGCASASAVTARALNVACSQHYTRYEQNECCAETHDKEIELLGPTVTGKRIIDACTETGAAMLIGPEGEVKCVGDNDFGRCGVDAATYPRLGLATSETMNGWPLTGVSKKDNGVISGVMQKVPKKAIEVAMSKEYSAVLLEDGTVDTFGQVPEYVSSLTNAVPKVSSICAGSRIFGVLEDTGSKTLTTNSTDSASATLNGVDHFACGYDHAIAVQSNGDVFEVKNGETQFTKLGNLPAAKFVAAGHSNSGIISADDKVYTFGTNNFGQLGHHFNDGGMQGVDKPYSDDVDAFDYNDAEVTLMPGAKPTFLSMGKSHSVVTLDNGYVVGFGLDAHGEVTGMSPAVIVDLGNRRTTGSHHVAVPNVPGDQINDKFNFATKIGCSDNLQDGMVSKPVDVAHAVPTVHHAITGELLAELRPTSWNTMHNVYKDGSPCDETHEVRATLPFDTPFYIVQGSAGEQGHFRSWVVDDTYLKTIYAPPQAEYVSVEKSDGFDFGDGTTRAVMGRANLQVYWFDRSKTFHAMTTLRREENPVNPRLFDLDWNQKRVQLTNNRALERSVAIAVAGFTSTYTILEDDYTAVYHGTNDVHGLIWSMGMGPNGGRDWTTSSFDLLEVDDDGDANEGMGDVDISAWFSKKTGPKIPPHAANIGPLRPYTFKFYDGETETDYRWDKVTYFKDDVREPPGMLSSFANVGGAVQACGEFGDGLEGGDTKIAECETNIYTLGSNLRFSYAGFIATKTLPLGFQQGNKYNPFEEGRFLNYYRNEFDGSMVLPDPDVQMPPPPKGPCKDDDAGVSALMSGYGLTAATCADVTDVVAGLSGGYAAFQAENFCVDSNWVDAAALCQFTCLSEENTCQPPCKDADPATLQAASGGSLQSCESAPAKAAEWGMDFCTDPNLAQMAALCPIKCPPAEYKACLPYCAPDHDAAILAANSFWWESWGDEGAVPATCAETLHAAQERVNFGDFCTGANWANDAPLCPSTCHNNKCYPVQN